MMAARGNAAKKMQEKEKKDKKRESKMGSDLISEEDLADMAEKMASEVPDKWRDPDCANNPITKGWMALSQRIRKFAYGERFGYFILGCIVVAGVLVGMQTYPGMETNSTVTTTDNIILYIFTAETGLKILSEGLAFPAFWLGEEWKWNNFDFFIVVACYLPADLFAGGEPPVALLRLLRLARLVKIFKKVPQLQMIVMGLAGGIKSIAYIVILLVLVFYLYAIVGITIFRTNDPWHYRDLQTTMLTLFRASTLEDWTDIMYISIFGCDQYSSIYVTQESWTPMNRKEWCVHPEQNQFLSPFFWVSFVIVSALVMLSLFIGAVTMSMTESMEQMKEEQEEATRLRMKVKQIKKMNAQKEEMQRRNSTLQEAALVDAMKGTEEGGKKDDDEGEKGAQKSFTIMGALGFGGNEEEKEQEQAQMTNMLVNIWDGADLDEMVNRVKTDEVTGSPGRVLWWHLSLFMKSIADSSKFQNFIIAVILVAGTMVGIQTFKEFEEENRVALESIDAVILYIFIVEIVIKMVAEDVYPLRFFISGWNCFDFLIVVGSLALAGTSSGGMMQMLRLLRLLRVLKLVKAFPQLQVIVNALMMGLSSIGFIGIILLLVFYMCAILGMMLFAENDPLHFGNLQISMLTLFRAATLEDWTDLMYINMYGCHKYGYSGYMEKYCTVPYPLGGETYWTAGVFFIFFTLLGALVLLTLFIGVVTTSMDEAQEAQNEEKAIEESIKEIQKNENLTDDEIETFLKVFQMLDLDGGGTIEEEELRVGLQSVGKDPTDEEMQQMMHDVDEDDSGEIDPAEFVQFMVNIRNEDRERAAKGGSEQDSLSGRDGADGENTPETLSPNKSLSPMLSFGTNGILAPPGGKTMTNLQVSALTPIKTAATLGAEANFGLPVLQSPTNENWLEMSLDMGRSKRKLPSLGSSAKIGISG
mmetsp:Transcript_14306/g.29405  ORF Transcript_14306/g.29405 Transcript_14306/m.29405 type:complete len:927 (+) Transcript_14306:101-2881(+)